MSINTRTALLGALVLGLPSPAALTRTASPAAKAFLDFLGSAPARVIFENAGFRAR